MMLHQKCHSCSDIGAAAPTVWVTSATLAGVGAGPVTEHHLPVALKPLLADRVNPWAPGAEKRFGEVAGWGRHD
jgi:hypothetical protein